MSHVLCRVIRGAEAPSFGVVWGMFPRGCDDTVARDLLLCKGGFSFSEFQPWMLIILTHTQLVLLSISNFLEAVLCLPRF